MTFAQFLIGLRTRWILILAMASLAVATTVAQSLLVGKIYVSDASVLVDLNAIDPMTWRTNPLLGNQALQQYFFVNKLYLAVSTQVSRRVAAEDPIVNSPEFIDYWRQETGGRGDIVAWYANILAQSVPVIIKKDATVITFRAHGASPERAAALANAFAKAYIDVTRNIKQTLTQARIDALEKHTKEVRAQLEAAWKAFTKDRVAGGITNFSELYNPKNIQTTQLNVQISEKKAEQIEADSRFSEFSKNRDSVPNVAGLNFSIDSLQSDMSRERAQLQQYKTILGAQHPSIKEGEARLSELQHTLDIEAARVQEQERQASTIYKKSTEQLLEKLKVEKAQSQQEMLTRNQLVAAIQKISSLSLNYSDAYLTTEYEKSNDLVAFSNLTLLSLANPPTEAALPNWLVIVPISALIGLLIGVGAAAWLERLDGRIHTPRLIQDKVRIPTLGVIQMHIAGISNS